MKLNRTKTFRIGVLGALVSVFVSGCLVGGGGSLTNLPETESATVSLVVRLGRIDASASLPGDLNTFAKRSSERRIELREMVVKFMSNLNDTLYDTVSAGEMAAAMPGSVFGSPEEQDQTVWVDVKLAPLRWWNIEIKTFDLNDSLIHYGLIGPFASKGGQSVTVDAPLINSRFSFYEARYSLPAEIYPANVPVDQRVYQKVFFSRLVLAIDGDTVRDTSSFSPNINSAGTRFISAGNSLVGAEGKFFFKPSGLGLDTITHVQAYKYVRTGPRVFSVIAYGYLEGDSAHKPPRRLFAGERPVTITPGSQQILPTPIIPDWVGPGSDKEPPDTNNPVVPGHPDWTGIGLGISIGKSATVTQQVEIPGGIDL